MTQAPHGAHKRAFRTISTSKRLALATASVTAIILAQAGATRAAEQAQQPQAAEANIEEVVVTGSRIVRDGYEAPTPTTVLGVEQMNVTAAPNIADTINFLPAFSGGTSTHASGGGGSNPAKGESQLNLRGLGANRTLVLIDGMRVPQASLDGAVDINVLPDSLVARVDIVTGGASAAYGSDALSGVVNFVLDHTFTGVKGSIQGGVTTYGDDRSFNINLTGGAAFAGGRGHFLINGSLANTDGIDGIPRPWNNEGWKIMNNPAYTATNGQPQLIILNHVGLAAATAGGLISSGPLKGIAFGPGGTPSQFNYGTVALGGMLMQGGDWQSNDFSNSSSLDQRVERKNAFTRVSFDITDGLQVFALASYGYGRSTADCCLPFYFPTLTVKSDNPFIPASVLAAMTANKVTTLGIGRYNTDLGHVTSSNQRTMTRLAVGATAKFDAFDSPWTLDTFLQTGYSRNSVNLHNSITTNFNLAIDAVRNPTTGAIVCRSTLTNPTNGCVPYNVMGVGVNSAAAIGYIEGDAHLNQNVRQNLASATLRGEPWENWAGKISFAMGAEYRRESTAGAADALSGLNSYFAGNFKPTFGAFTVTEGFAETVIPLAKDTGWAKALDLNAAVRATDYTTSGYVTTWKVGATYTPIDDLKFRATRSRDIRAPNLLDSFLAGTRTTGPLQDPTRGNTSANAQTVTIGNPNLKAEVADSTGLGVVIQPQFFPGFNTSFDYYNIEISGAIANVSAQNIINRCYDGQADLCPAVIRDSTGAITQVIAQQFNLVSQRLRGFDIEASYSLRLDNISDNWMGTVALRALGTHVIGLTSNDGQSPVTDASGANGGNGPPKWRWLLSAGYSNDPIAITVTGRAISAGKYSNSYVVCTSGCPTSIATAQTINGNYIPGAFLTDLSVTYKLSDPDSASRTELFLAIQNIANKDPAVVAPSGGSNFYVNDANPGLYDTLGRQFRLGLRFKM